MLTTDRQVAAVAATTKNQMLRLAPSLYLRVKATTGAKSYVMRLQHGGRDRWLSVGRPPVMKLAEAMTLAHGRLAGTTQLAPNALTCGQALDLFERQHVQRKWKRLENATPYLNWLRSELASVPLRNLSKSQLLFVIRGYATRPGSRPGSKGGAVSTNRLTEMACNWLNWCVGCDYLPHSPATGLQPRFTGGDDSTGGRARVLSMAELADLWRMDGVHGPILRACLLSACRIGELQKAQIRHLEWDDDARSGPRSLVIPAAHSKNGRAHRVPMTSMFLSQVRVSADPNALLFPEVSCHPTNVQNWLRRSQMAAGVAERWSPHDLRRTAASRLGALGVPIETIQRVLNHTLAGAVAVYARHDYYPERRDALEKLSRWVGENVAAPVEFAA